MIAICEKRVNTVRLTLNLNQGRHLENPCCQAVCRQLPIKSFVNISIQNKCKRNIIPVTKHQPIC